MRKEAYFQYLARMKVRTTSSASSARWSLLAPAAMAVSTASVLVAVTSSSLMGCGNESKLPANAPKNLRDIVVRHEACDEAGRGEMLDANNDGKPEVKRIVDGSGKEVCRVSDVDFDGKVDMYTYFDAAGQVRRIEIGFGDGHISSIETHEGGKLVKREIATTNQDRIDTWDFFDATGKRVRRERDSNGDAKIDQWWAWDGEKLSIRIDRDDDGEPDPTDLMSATPTPKIADMGDASVPVPPVTTGPTGESAVAGPSTAVPGLSATDGGK